MPKSKLIRNFFYIMKTMSHDTQIKNDVIKLIKALPEDITLEDIQYHLFVKQKLLKAKNQEINGKTFSNKEVMESARKKWLK